MPDTVLCMKSDKTKDAKKVWHPEAKGRMHTKENRESSCRSCSIRIES